MKPGDERERMTSPGKVVSRPVAAPLVKPRPQPVERLSPGVTRGPDGKLSYTPKLDWEAFLTEPEPEPKAPTHEELFAAQQKWWPGSDVMDWEGFMDKIRFRCAVAGDLAQYASLVQTIQALQPEAIPYRLSGSDGRCLGIRTGVEQGEYISGFPPFTGA